MTMKRVGLAVALALVSGWGGCGSMDWNDDSGGSGSTEASPAYGSVPRSASRVAQQRGRFAYRATENGRAWIGNDTRRQVVTETYVGRGDEITVDPGADRVSVNGQIVFDQNMERSEEHSVFVLADGAGSGGGPGGVVGDPGAYPGVSSRAQRLAAGYESVRGKAPATGKVWVVNAEKRFVVTSFDVAAGDEIDVDVKHDKVYHNKIEVYSQNLESKHEHVVFYHESMGSAGYGKIPSDAERVASGKDAIEYRVERDGNVWVGDDELRRELVLHHVKAGDLVVVDVKHDQVKLNGKAIYSQNLESKHHHSIYFRAR